MDVARRRRRPAPVLVRSCPSVCGRAASRARNRRPRTRCRARSGGRDGHIRRDRPRWGKDSVARDTGRLYGDSPAPRHDRRRPRRPRRRGRGGGDGRRRGLRVFRAANDQQAAGLRRPAGIPADAHGRAATASCSERCSGHRRREWGGAGASCPRSRCAGLAVLYCRRAGATRCRRGYGDSPGRGIRAGAAGVGGSGDGACGDGRVVVRRGSGADGHRDGVVDGARGGRRCWRGLAGAERERRGHRGIRRLASADLCPGGAVTGHRRGSASGHRCGGRLGCAHVGLGRTRRWSGCADAPLSARGNWCVVRERRVRRRSDVTGARSANRDRDSRLVGSRTLAARAGARAPRNRGGRGGCAVRVDQAAPSRGASTGSYHRCGCRNRNASRARGRFWSLRLGRMRAALGISAMWWGSRSRQTSTRATTA